MNELLLYLNSLIILSGISIAVTQHLFSNHKGILSDLLKEVDNITFKDDNTYEKELKKRWEKALSSCRKHSYTINPNTLIYIWLLPIVFIGFIFLLNSIDTIHNILFFKKVAPYLIITIALVVLILLFLSVITFKQMINKENDFKKEFNEIQEKHDLALKVLNERNE